jgi:hypothetical protein
MNQQIAHFLRENALFLSVMAALLGGFFLLRTRGTELASTDEFTTLISSGQPAVVEFYSNT